MRILTTWRGIQQGKRDTGTVNQTKYSVESMVKRLHQAGGMNLRDRRPCQGMLYSTEVNNKTTKYSTVFKNSGT